MLNLYAVQVWHSSEPRDIETIRVRTYTARRAELSESVTNAIGYRKEIDHALERIAAIEKHLGIIKKIAA